MPSLLERLLRITRPSNLPLRSGDQGWVTSSFWSDARPWDDGDRPERYLLSYDAIYRSQPVVAGVVDKLARRVATLPFAAYTEETDGSRAPIDHEDPLALLLRRPMQRSSTTHLLAHVMTSLLVHGNALVAKVRSELDEPPDMLWPLDWASVSAYAEPGNRIEWWSTVSRDGRERFLRAEDVVHFAWPAADGAEIGVSPLEKLGVTLRLEDAAQRHQTAMFANGSRPSLAVSVEHDNPTVPILQATRERVEAMHKGASNSGRTFFMGANVKVQPLSMSPVEVELVQQRRLDREEVAIVYDLSGPSLSDVTNASMGNVVERNRAFYRDVVPPWTTLITETLQTQLLDAEPAWSGRVTRFDFTDKLRGEPREQAEKLRIEVEAGLRTRNEARRELGLPPDGEPNDPANPANRLTANLNNQGAVAEIGAPPDTTTQAPIAPRSASE